MKNHITAIFSIALLVACSPADPDNASNDECPCAGTGMRVVDYSVEENPRTKAYGEGLAPQERISSLIYLLYDSQGTLVKERVIPGIGPETEWPLTRPEADGQGGNMTWEQREALKDTLESGRTYTAVFVANADPALFGLDGLSEDGTLLHYKTASSGDTPLYGMAETGTAGDYAYSGLGDVFLSMPQEPFKDNNMFYIDVKPIDLTASDELFRCSIYLQRIVSRTDISRLDPDTDYCGTAGDDEAADAARLELLKPLAERDLYPVVNAALETQLDAVLERISSGLVASSELAGTNFLLYAADLNSEDALHILSAALKEQTMAYIADGCTADAMLKTRLQSWKGADVGLSVSGLASRFFIGDSFEASVPGTDPGQNAMAELSYTADETGVLSVIGFGDGSGTFNSLASMEFSGISGEGATDFTLDGITGFYLWHGKNVRNTAVCNPVSSMAFKDQGHVNEIVLECDLNALFGEGSGFSSHWDSAYTQALDRIVSGNGYGTSFSDVSLVADVPAFVGTDNSSNLTASVSINPAK